MNKTFNVNEAYSLKEYYLKNKNFEQGIIEYNKLLEPEADEQFRSGLLKKFNIEEKVFTHNDYIYKYYEKLWKKEDLTDKVLFVFSYQSGFGDYIMYARYIPMLQKLAEKVIIQVHKNLYDLYKYNFPSCEVIQENINHEYKGKYDYTYHHELFLNLQNDLQSFPYADGYLNADFKLIEKYSSIFKTDKKKVGIFWANTTGNRSVPTDLMIPIFELQNCQFYTINKDMPTQKTAEIIQKYGMIELREYIHNAHDTAALMKHMDLVISIDSFPVHLAGALGVKTYLLLPFDSTWRWFNDYHTTRWYNSVKIFKQNYFDEWEDVVRRVSDSLKSEF